jgi:uncharacterized protein YjiS (DUF1127 family)
MSHTSLATWHDAHGAFTGPRWRTRLRPNLAVIFALWRARRRTRQQLSVLDDRALADVGLSRTQQRIECAKAPWQP